MVLELDGTQRRDLRDALLSAYATWDDLRIMVSDQLDESLSQISAQANQTHVTFNLIEWARSRGRLAELIEGGRRSNPENPKLFVFAQKMGLVSTDAKRSTLEKIVGNNTVFLDVAKWRAALTRMEWRVCRVDIDGKGNGTGFLIGPDAIMTNYHVVKPAIEGNIRPSEITCRFDYKLAPAGDVISTGSSFSLADDWFVDAQPYSSVDLEPDPKSGEPADDELDYALLRLKERVGDKPPGGTAGHAEKRGWVKINKDPVNFDDQRVVAILQHPQTNPMKLALGMEQQIDVNDAGNRIRYTVPTEGGSSGSPVFNGDWKLLAIHHAGDPDTIKPEFNEAIPISKIAEQPKVNAWLKEMEDEED